MPGMTTVPLLQSALPVSSSAKSLNGTVAPVSGSDGQNTSASSSHARVANTANSPAADPATGAEAGNAPDSFADALQRQLAQDNTHETASADFKPVVDLTLPAQPISGLAPMVSSQLVASSQPVSVESLMSDLSNFVDRLSLHGSGPAPLTGGSGAAAEDQIESDAAKALAVFLDASPVDQAAAIDVLLAESNSHLADPATEDAPAEGVPLDGLASITPFIQLLRPNEASGPAGDDQDPAARNAGSLLTASPLPTAAMEYSDAGMQAPPTTTSDFLLETAAKSADIAATQATLAEVTSPTTGPGESKEPERSFDSLLAAAQTASQHRTGGAHAASSASPAMQRPVGTPGWDGEVADKLVWMVGRQEQRAELVLNPPQMGRIEVSLSMNDGQTSALFVSANPAVRDALEAALPRLREILADAGISLGQTQVGADTGNSSTNDAENRDNSKRGLSNGELSHGNEILKQLDAPQWLKRGNGLVDIFA